MKELNFKLEISICFLTLFLSFSLIGYGQNPTTIKVDTIQANKHFQRGDSLRLNYKHKQALEEFEKAASIYLKEKHLQKYWEAKAKVCYLWSLLNVSKAKELTSQLLNEVIQHPSNTDEKDYLVSDIYSSLSFMYAKLNQLDTAFVYAKKGLKLRLEILEDIHPDLNKFYYNLGYVYQCNNQHDSALVCYHKSLEINLTCFGKHHASVFACYSKIAWIFFVKGDYDKAITYFQKYAFGKELIYGEKHSQTAKAYSELGRAYTATQQLDSAYFYLNKAKDIYINHIGEEYIETVYTYTSLGRLYTLQGQYKKSLSYNLKSIQIYSRLFKIYTPTTISLYLVTGNDYNKLGNYQKALEYYQKALDIGIECQGKNHVKVSEANLSIGSSYLERGLYHKALDYHQKSLAINQSNPAFHKDVPVQIYRGLARIHANLGDDNLALKYYQKALKAEKSGKSIFIPKLDEIYLDMGELFMSTNQNDKAIKYFHLALPLLTGNIKKIDAFLDLAKSHYALDQKDSTFYYTQQALNYAQNDLSVQDYALINIYNVKSEILFQEKQYQQALSHAHKAIEINLRKVDDYINLLSSIQLNNIIFPQNILLSLQLWAKCQEQIYLTPSEKSFQFLEHVFKTYQKTDQLLTQMKLNYDYEADQLEFAKKSYKIYLGAIRISTLLLQETQDKKYQEAAFYFAEKSKAYLLYNSLLDANAREFAGIPQELLNQDRWLKNKIAFFQKEVAKLQKDQVSLVRDSLFHYKQCYTSLIKSLEREYPDYYQLKYSDKPTTIADLQKTLKYSAGLLEYIIDEQQLYIFYIDQNQFLFKQITLSSSDKQMLKKYPAYLRQFNERKYLKAAPRLYNLLIKPFEKQLTDKRHLLFVSNGMLHKIPMETLLTHQVSLQSTDFTSLPYLLKGFTTSYFPSATLAAFQQKQKPTQQNGFLGFAPVFQDGESHGNILPANRAITRFRGSDSSVVVNGKRFEPLPHSENELKGIQVLLKDNQQPVKIYLHKEACEEQFKAEIGKYRYVHLASHSWANETNGLLSYILFAQPDSAAYAQSMIVEKGQAPMEDGVLYANEMYSMDWNADLVVLSSCKSGLGEYVAGEGVLTFTRGLLYGGVHNVLYSLWNVNDEATADLMLSFYQNHFQKEMSYAESLRAAKLDLLNHPNRAFPFWWAAFSLLGRE